MSKLDCCEGLTPNSKSLIWENGESTIDILPKSQRKFHLLFAQERRTSRHENQIMDLECLLVEGKRKKISPVAWVGTRRTVETLKIEKSKIDMLEAKIQKLERKYHR